MNVSKTKERIALALVVVSIAGRWLILPGLALPGDLAHIAENAFQGLLGAALVLYLMSGLHREIWQKADPKTRREMEVAQRDERNQLMEEKAAAFVVNRKQKANNLPADVYRGLRRGYHLRLPRHIHGDTGARWEVQLGHARCLQFLIGTHL